MGALNHAEWLQQELDSIAGADGADIKVMVLMDGGWFLPLAKASLVADTRVCCPTYSIYV